MPGKFKAALSVFAAISIACPGHAAAASVVVESGPEGKRTVLECQPGFMPVVTEGPTDEFHNGQRIHSDIGIRKCIEIPGDARAVDGGSAARIKVAADRWLEVMNCPAGTVPLTWQFERYSPIVEEDAPVPQRYAVFARVLIRCIEVVEPAAQGGR